MELERYRPFKEVEEVYMSGTFVANESPLLLLIIYLAIQVITFIDSSVI